MNDTTEPLPADAVTAAMLAFSEMAPQRGHTYADALTAALDAAAPALRAQGAATERETCARLAEQHASQYDHEIGRVDMPLHGLADLIRARTTP